MTAPRATRADFTPPPRPFNWTAAAGIVAIWLAVVIWCAASVGAFQ